MDFQELKAAGKRATKAQALEYLADTVAQYVEADHPVHCLTGQEAGGRPDSYHLAELTEVLDILGYRRAAAKLKDLQEPPPPRQPVPFRFPEPE